MNDTPSILKALILPLLWLLLSLWTREKKFKEKPEKNPVGWINGLILFSLGFSLLFSISLSLLFIGVVDTNYGFESLGAIFSGFFIGFIPGIIVGLLVCLFLWKKICQKAILHYTAPLLCLLTILFLRS